ncbi:MAG: glycosyltransferase family 4 protein [Sulfuricaulis sp.]|uniref:glycosyltransferase family 4 protein n=1 Tax=Sulfuricaulis sp. TaxID=2003553 RepID=UPI0034A2419D
MTVAKIIFLNRYFFPDHSATSQLLTDLAFDLASRGREVHVITSRQRYDEPGARLPPQETIRGVTVHRVWTSTFGRGRLAGRTLDYLTFYLSAGWALFRLARAGDVVVSKTDPPLLSLVAGPVTRLKNARLVNWLQDIFPEIAGVAGMGWAKTALGRFLARLRDWTLRSAETNVVLSTAMEQYLLSRGIGMERVRVIPNWADGESIRPVAAPDNDLRKSWRLEGKFVVGYSGNMGRVHEFETILEAAAELKEEDGVVFLFIGDGAQRNWIEHRVRELGLGNVLFQPYQPREALSKSLSLPNAHLVSLLPTAEGYVFPSKLYGILAAGRPVIFIGESNGEIARLIHEAECGYAVQAGDASRLTATITRLNGDPEMCGRLGENARRLFDDRFDKRLAFAAWEKVLNS